MFLELKRRPLMEMKINNEIGAVIIGEEVIAMIAGASANEAYGIVGMASRGAKMAWVVS